MTETRPAGPDRRHIVVGVDGSPGSVEALRWAEYLAQQMDADLEAVTTWEAPIGWDDEGWIDDANPRDEARRHLRTAVRTVYGRNRPSHLSTSVLLDSAVTALVTASKTATLVVVGSRGHGRMAGMLLGSVSSALAARAACPVVVVHGRTVPD